MAETAGEDHPVDEKAAFRGRIIPAALCWVFGAFLLLGSMANAGMATYFYVTYGPLERYPDTDTFNNVRPTPLRIAAVTVGCIGGCVGVIAGNAWKNWNIRKALICSIILIVCLGVAANLMSSRRAVRKNAGMPMQTMNA